MQLNLCFLDTTIRIMKTNCGNCAARCNPINIYDVKKNGLAYYIPEIENVRFECLFHP